MRLKSDAKFKEKLTCSFKYDMRDLVNFLPATQKSRNFTSMGYFYQLEKFRGIMCHNTERWCKI